VRELEADRDEHIGVLALVREALADPSTALDRIREILGDAK
jgi:hypothetical protein